MEKETPSAVDARLDLSGFQVVDDSDDDPVLLRADGSPVDTWRQGYPYAAADGA